MHTNTRIYPTYHRVTAPLSAVRLIFKFINSVTVKSVFYQINFALLFSFSQHDKGTEMEKEKEKKLQEKYIYIKIND